MGCDFANSITVAIAPGPEIIGIAMGTIRSSSSLFVVNIPLPFGSGNIIFREIIKNMTPPAIVIACCSSPNISSILSPKNKNSIKMASPIKSSRIIIGIFLVSSIFFRMLIIRGTFPNGSSTKSSSIAVESISILCLCIFLDICNFMSAILLYRKYKDINMNKNRGILEQSTIIASVAKWIFLSGVVGIIIGAIVTLFLNLLHHAEASRGVLPFHYYYLLPFGLVFSVWLTKTFAPDAKGHGTEKVIEAVHKKSGEIKVSVIPVKLFATIVTLFAGGSAGKEGPGAQIGAGTASVISDFLHFSKKDRKKLVVCGISAGFATVFGTPIAGAIFGIEVLVVGTLMYDLLLPSIVAGFSAFFTAQYLGAHYTYYEISYFQHYFIDIILIGKVILGGIFFGLVAYSIVSFLKRTEIFIEKIDMNPYKKAFLSGLLLVLLSYIVGDKFFGLGLDTISDTMQFQGNSSGDVPWYAFIVKIFYTAVTLGSGGSGGIVTPIFYIGATSGQLFGGWFGGEHQLALFAALGFVSVLAGATNAPIAALIMAMELFGMDVAHYAAVSIAISFLVLGHRSVFPSQKLAMRKSDMLDINYGEDIEHSSVALEDEHIQQFARLKRRLRIEKLKNDRVAKVKKRKRDSK